MEYLKEFMLAKLHSDLRIERARLKRQNSFIHRQEVHYEWEGILFEAESEITKGVIEEIELQIKEINEQ
jgi:hypothetical protein